MSRSRPWSSANPDLRRQTQVAAPAIEPLEQQLYNLLSPANFKPLEELRRQLKALRDKPDTVLGGKLMMVVEAFSHRPVASWYTDAPKANDKTFADKLLECLPQQGLLIFDLGFFKFDWFDAFTNTEKFFVTRLREKTAYRVTRCLSQGLYFRDEVINLGQYRSNPCQPPLRLVSVLWGDTWYYYLTNVLDPEQLSAQQVCELYRRRWRVEEAFLLTKRLLGLAYLWVGDTNGVQIQIFATWIFYAVLNDLCSQVAVALNQPLERISVEMVFRGLYHFARAFVRGDATDVVAYLNSKAKLLGVVKARRKRHRDIDAHTQLIWGSTSLS